MDLTLQNKIPSVDEYNQFRQYAGWDTIPTDKAKLGLDQSTISICAYNRENLIGMGRIFGDGGIYFYVQDMIVHPDFQSKGVGTMIMSSLLSEWRERFDSQGFLMLMAAEGKSAFYKKFGFRERASDSPGMQL